MRKLEKSLAGALSTISGCLRTWNAGKTAQILNMSILPFIPQPLHVLALILLSGIRSTTNVSSIARKLVLPSPTRLRTPTVAFVGRLSTGKAFSA